MLRKVFLFFILACSSLICFGGYFIYHDVINFQNKFDEGRFFLIEKGQGLDEIGKKMVSDGLAYDEMSVRLILKLASRYKNIHFGEYEIEPHEKFSKVLYKVLAGKVYVRKIRIPSGLTNREIFKLLDNNPYLSGTYDKKSILEGMLFADTYNYYRGDQRQKLVDRMVSLTNKTLWKEWIKRDKTLPYKSMFDGLIVASIIEKEAFYFDDKKRVASVFMNRIKIGQKLQSDPTVQYHIDLLNGKKTKLAGSHFRMESHYSTYYLDYLPVTAICNPSIKSIKAAFHPDKTNYFYFISMPNDVRLFFSKDYKEHMNYVARLYRERRESGWRDTYGELDE
jgi:UPF0755 protein